VKIKKSVTGKVIAANQANAHKTTGPQNTKAVSQNARKHGLLAKYLPFQNEEEEEEFNMLQAELDDEYQPCGETERALAGEIAICLWKLQILNGWELQEITNRRKAAKAILRAVAENYDEEPLPLFTKGDGSRSAAQLGWDCQELIVRTGTRKSEQDESFSGDTKDKAGHVQIEAKLNTSLDTILRYQAALKRDLYRAIAALRAIQGQRCGENDAGKTNDEFPRRA
jgi:hypothetical protein